MTASSSLFPTQLGQDYAILLPSRSIWIPKYKSLIISDIHLDKVHSFRSNGVPLPQMSSSDNCEKLLKLVETYQPHQIIVVGDFFHAQHVSAGTLDFLRALLLRVKILLVRGNHDIHSSYFYQELGVQCVGSTTSLGSLVLVHDPKDANQNWSTDRHIISGHIHPAISLQGFGRQSLRVPCFVTSLRRTILPAFGAFTGSASIAPAAEDRIIAVADDTVVLINNNLVSRPRKSSRW